MTPLRSYPSSIWSSTLVSRRPRVCPPSARTLRDVYHPPNGSRFWTPAFAYPTASPSSATLAKCRSARIVCRAVATQSLLLRATNGLVVVSVVSTSVLR